MSTREARFAAVLDDHAWHFYGYFASRLRSRGDAEDLARLTFERALKANVQQILSRSLRRMRVELEASHPPAGQAR